MAKRSMMRQSQVRLDDEALCAAVALADDDAAFTELASRHREWLVGLCRKHLDGDGHLAEDVAQECLVKLHAALRRDHRPLRPRAWLSVVARHACIDVHRTSRARPTDELPDDVTEDLDPFDTDPVLTVAWEALTDRQRMVLHHRELMGLRYDEIATVMETSTSAVETLLFRARMALRRNYQRAGGQLLGCGLFGLGFMRFVDGVPSGELSAHVSRCRACQQAAARLHETAGLLRLGGNADVLAVVTEPTAGSLLSTRRARASEVLWVARERVRALLHSVAPTLTAPDGLVLSASGLSKPVAAAALALGGAATAFAGATGDSSPSVAADRTAAEAPLVMGNGTQSSTPLWTASAFVAPLAEVIRRAKFDGAMEPLDPSEPEWTGGLEYPAPDDPRGLGSPEPEPWPPDGSFEDDSGRTPQQDEPQDVEAPMSPQEPCRDNSDWSSSPGWTADDPATSSDGSRSGSEASSCWRTED